MTDRHYANGEFDGRQFASSAQGWRFELHGDLKFLGKTPVLETDDGTIVYRLAQARLEIVPTCCHMLQRELGYSESLYGPASRDYVGTTDERSESTVSTKAKLGISLKPSTASGAGGLDADRATQNKHSSGGVLTDTATVKQPVVVCLGIDPDGRAQFLIRSPMAGEPLIGDVLDDEDGHGRLATVHGDPGSEDGKGASVRVFVHPKIRLSDVDWERSRLKGVLGALFGKRKLERAWFRDPRENLALILLSCAKDLAQPQRFIPPRGAGLTASP